MTILKISIEKIENPKEGERYGQSIDVYEQNIDYDWIIANNPNLISKVIAVVNDLNIKEKP